MSGVFLAIGLVLAFEGLVFALAPSRLEQLLRQLAELPVESRRLLGFLAITTGALFLWLAKWLMS